MLVFCPCWRLHWFCRLYFSWRDLGPDTQKKFWPFSGCIDRIAEECDRKQGKRGEWHAAKGPGPGVEPGSAAEPLHMGHTHSTNRAKRRPKDTLNSKLLFEAFWQKYCLCLTIHFYLWYNFKQALLYDLSSTTTGLSKINTVSP